MSRTLPFTSLRTFEAVARLGSFSRAARELGVSQSAVSQHVKGLEEWLGQPLLIRTPRHARPTPEGARLALVVAEGMGQISRACTRLREDRRATRSIKISCLPGFAFIWLFPRLQTFDLAHPNLTLSVTTETGGTGYSAGDADVGIRYGSGENPGLTVEPLMGEEVTPVCSPALLRSALPLREVSDLALHTRLQDEFSPFIRTPPTWEYWAEQTGVSLPKPARVRTFDQSHMVHQAALSGLGVALGRTPLITEALRDGRLVRPFAQSARSKAQYWLVYEQDAPQRERIALFLDWIRAEAAASTPLPPWTAPIA